MLITFEGLCKSYRDKIIFKDLSGRINKGHKIGLIGENGIGKTTLLKLLCKKESCDLGNMTNNCNILYLEQNHEFKGYKTVFEEAENFSIGKNNAKFEIEKALALCGLSKDLWSKKAFSLSGGEKTRLLHAKILLCDYDLLILDEPTNHLDETGCTLLIKMLKNLKKTILIVSHDRYFLDETVKEIWQLTSKGLKVYEGNYTKYKATKENEDKNKLLEYEKQQGEIKHLKEIINDRKNWFKSAHDSAGQNDFLRAKAKKQARIFKAKEKELERLQENPKEKPEEIHSPAFDIINKEILNTKLPPFIIKVSNLTKSYDNKVIVCNASFSIGRGDKVALLGENGAGKSTILKIITRSIKDYEGSVKINPSVKIGYFAQEFDNMNLHNTVLEEALSSCPNQNEARVLLGSLLFRGSDVEKRAESLSMGERCRLAFAKIILQGINVLILDEPTNHMDIFSRENMESVLKEFKGAVIFVSHDKYFVKNIATKIYKIENKKVLCFNGAYEEYEKSSAYSKSTKSDLKIKDEISTLELKLAFLSGKLDEYKDEEEKNNLTLEFMETARALKLLKE